MKALITLILATFVSAVGFAQEKNIEAQSVELNDLISFVAKSKGGTTEQIQELLDSFEMTQCERQPVYVKKGPTLSNIHRERKTTYRSLRSSS